MPKKKEEPEVTAAVETSESTAEVTDIEPVPVEPAAEVPAEPTKPAVEEPPKPKRTRKKKTDAVDEEALPEPQPAAPKETAAKKKETAAADRQNKPKADPILTLEVGGEVTTETHEMDAAWHEILTSNRSHRILTGMLGGVEETEAGKTLAVVDYKGFRVVIPLKEMLVKLEKNLKGTEYTEMIRRQNKLLSNMLGCEIDFIVKGVDQKTRTVVASRKEAMLKKRQVFYMNQDTSGAYRIYEGRTVQARVIAVAEKAVRIEAFGVECSIMARDLSWDWIGDANDRFSVGDQILVRILEVNRDSLEELSIRADVKSVSENTNRTYLKQCRVQSKYAGKVTDVHKGVVYVRLNNGANAIAHTCLDRRTPGKKDDVSFAVTHIDEDRGVAVGIITRITGIIGAGCLLIGVSMCFILKDRIMLFLSLAVFVASAGRALSYYRIITDKSYETVEGVCVSVVPKPLRKYRKIKIMDGDGNESTMLLGKQSKVKIGYRYRFYFKETQHISLGSEYLNSAMSSDHFLGYEELGEFTAEATE